MARWAALNRAGITGTSGTIQGDFATIMANLNKELAKLKVRSNRGLLLAAIDIRRDMEKNMPYIPLKYGNLRASFFITTKKNASPTVRTLTVKGGNFSSAAPSNVVAQLKSDHPVVVDEVQNQLGQFEIGVGLGFSAFYAAPVHEMVANYTTGKPVNWNKQGSGAKFFQAAIYRNLDNIVNTVRINARIP